MYLAAIPIAIVSVIGIVAGRRRASKRGLGLLPSVVLATASSFAGFFVGGFLGVALDLALKTYVFILLFSIGGAAFGSIHIPDRVQFKPPTRLS